MTTCRARDHLPLSVVLTRLQPGALRFWGHQDTVGSCQNSPTNSESDEGQQAEGELSAPAAENKWLWKTNAAPRILGVQTER